jgi:phosphorylcholine metabolism protein LicD
MKGDNNMKHYVYFSHQYHLFKLLKLLINKFNDKKIFYFLSCGGLIGYHRHNNSFISWDDDLDIVTLEEDKERVKECLSEIINENINLKSLTDAEHINRLIYNESYIADIYIDIFFIKYYEDKGYYHYNKDIMIKLYPNEHITEEQIGNRKLVDFYLYLPDGEIYDGIKLYIPTKSEEFLDNAYPGWKTTFKYKNPHGVFYSIF